MLKNTWWTEMCFSGVLYCEFTLKWQMKVCEDACRGWEHEQCSSVLLSAQERPSSARRWGAAAFSPTCSSSWNTCGPTTSPTTISCEWPVGGSTPKHFSCCHKVKVFFEAGFYGGMFKHTECLHLSNLDFAIVRNSAGAFFAYVGLVEVRVLVNAGRLRPPFRCESCRAKLRSYQALLKHLHTCAKVAKNKVAKAEPDMADGMEMAPDATLLSAGPPEPPDANQGGMENMQVDPGPPAPPRDSRPGSAATAAPLLTVSVGGLPPDGPLAPAPGAFPLLEPPPFSQQSLIIPGQPLQDVPPMPFPTYQAPMQSSPPPSYGQHQLQQQQRLLRTAGPAPPGPLAPPASPGSNAVWRKNQGE